MSFTQRRLCLASLISECNWSSNKTLIYLKKVIICFKIVHKKFIDLRSQTFGNWNELVRYKLFHVACNTLLFTLYSSAVLSTCFKFLNRSCIWTACFQMQASLQIVYDRLWRELCKINYSLLLNASLTEDEQFQIFTKILIMMTLYHFFTERNLIFREVCKVTRR